MFFPLQHQVKQEQQDKTGSYLHLFVFARTTMSTYMYVIMGILPTPHIVWPEQKLTTIKEL